MEQVRLVSLVLAQPWKLEKISVLFLSKQQLWFSPSLYKVCCKLLLLLFCLVLTAANMTRRMVCVGQFHSQHPPLHCGGVINTAELILKSPVVGTSHFPMRNVMTSIITFLLHSLFSPSKQPGELLGRKCGEISFLFLFFAGSGDPVKNHYIYLYSYRIKDNNTDCMPIC